VALRTLFPIAACALLTSLPAVAQTVATAEMRDREGHALGHVTVQEAVAGGVLVRVDLERLPAGAHAFHIHAVGACEPPDFTSAGGHLAGDEMHGFMREEGPHPGDFPNIRPSADGSVRQVFYNTRLDVSGDTKPVLDADGSAVVIHAAADDHRSQPAGNAGPRIACGILEPVDM
jgi:Cu-Zn family superoxide dismutase